MPMIFPPNSLPRPFRSASESTPFTYDGTVSSNDVGPYQAPMSSSWELYLSQYALCVVGSQASVWKSMSPRATPE